MGASYQQYEKLRKKNNVTTYRVCKDGKISTTIMSNWKSGNTSPSVMNLIKLARYFKVPITYFLDDE